LRARENMLGLRTEERTFRKAEFRISGLCLFEHCLKVIECYA
jgi:hypothetical protein